MIWFSWWCLAGIRSEWFKCVQRLYVRKRLRNGLSHHGTGVWIGLAWCVVGYLCPVSEAVQVIRIQYAQGLDLATFMSVIVSCLSSGVCLCCWTAWGRLVSFCPTDLMTSFPCRSQLWSDLLSLSISVYVWMSSGARLCECAWKHATTGMWLCIFMWVRLRAYLLRHTHTITAPTFHLFNLNLFCVFAHTLL